jgi:hypothetical protein
MTLTCGRCRRGYRTSVLSIYHVMGYCRDCFAYLMRGNSR